MMTTMTQLLFDPLFPPPERSRGDRNRCVELKLPPLRCWPSTEMTFVPIVERLLTFAGLGQLGVYPSLTTFDARLLQLWRCEDARPWFAFDEDRMAGSGFRPAPQVELDGVSTGPGWTGGDFAQPFNVGPLRPSKRTHDEQRETADVDADLQAADVDDFRMWWEQGFAEDRAEGRPRGWKLTPTARAVVGVAAIIGTVLALKGGRA